MKTLNFKSHSDINNMWHTELKVLRTHLVNFLSFMTLNSTRLSETFCELTLKHVAIKMTVV